MLSVTTLALKFPRLGTPTEAAKHYGLLSDEFLDNLTGPGRFMLDLACLSEVNRRDNERQEKTRKDREYSSQYPGCKRYEGEDKWDVLKRAKNEENRLRALNQEKERRGVTN